MNHYTAPSISVIVAVFNGAKTLQQCIDSVAQQTYPNKELIVIDGGSTDGTVDLLKANREKINYWISEPDGGIYNAWNKGLAKEKGEWICFLGADDYFWNARVLDDIAEQLRSLPREIKVAYGQVMLVTPAGSSLYVVGEPWEKVKKQFAQVMSIPHQGVMHRRALFEQHGRFDESFRIAGDYELLLRELTTANAAYMPDTIVAGMQVGGVSSNPQNSILLLREMRKAQVMHGQRLLRGTWVLALARVYMRLFLWRVLGESRTRKLLDFYRAKRGLSAIWTKS